MDCRRNICVPPRNWQFARQFSGWCVDPLGGPPRPEGMTLTPVCVCANALENVASPTTFGGATPGRRLDCSFSREFLRYSLLCLGGLSDTVDWPASLGGRGLVYPASGFQPAKDSPGPRPFPPFPVVFGFTSFSVVSATRSFWRTILGRHVLVLALFGSVHGEPPERAYVVGFVVSGQTGVFHEFHVSGRSVSRIYIGVRFKTHKNFGPKSARGCCLPISHFR